MRAPSRQCVAVLLALAAATVLTGCGGSYVLSGRVVDSDFPSIEFVGRDDDMLVNGDGVPGAQINVYRDPDTLGRELVASGRSARDGTFKIPIPGFGVGWLQEQWLIQVTRGSFESFETLLVMPGKGSKRRTLILLHRGVSSPLGEEGLWDQYERFK